MVKVSDLEGKVTALYFSANWYPPCQNFTEVLVSAYEELRNSDKEGLKQKFDIEGIPCLVVLQPDAEDDAILCNGVELIYRYGIEAFPFTKDKLERAELRQTMTEEMEKHRDCNNKQKIRYLISEGL
ncbi:hypothetical protein Pint_34129 [Pistacia integerrima]|uniref:Uncharacterized protein n=1 Tax=Pistacia integerrima TaxID=434235 RepID=A0ACC0X6S9_9ROSI|nr:hypothetical protein Pint_34129 [Pistacia integerrima]